VSAIHCVVSSRKLELCNTLCCFFEEAGVVQYTLLFLQGSAVSQSMDHVLIAPAHVGHHIKDVSTSSCLPIS
jgi:hypothetical protein